MTKDQLIAEIAKDVDIVLAPAKRVKDIVPGTLELWASPVFIKTSETEASNAVQEFFYRPDTGEAFYPKGGKRSDDNKPAPDPAPEVSAFQRAKTALDTAFPGQWKYVKHVTDSNGTLVTITVAGIKKVVTLLSDGSVLDADAE